MKIILETLGCKLNQAETEALARQFLQAGHTLVNREDDADIYILNTCTVTHTADSKGRHLLRMARRRHPAALVVATGCYAQRSPYEIARMAAVNLVVGNEGKASLLENLREMGKLTETGTTHPQRNDSTRRTRAFVKIQDGCSNYCAYCIVPYVRGREKSPPAAEVISEVKQRAAEGYQEVVITGTRIGAYHNGNTDLKGLLARILTETAIPRLRLSSLQSWEISASLLRLWQDRRLCPHFHLSLQSGSGSVLARMRRRYTPAEYEATVAMIRETVPAVAITTDVIVGFPGETEAEFQESLEFCRRLDFARIHVFPFSPRAGTEAAAMPGKVSDKVKQEHTRQMLALAAESARKFREKFAGETLDVLWEKQTGAGVWSGVTGNYLRVYRRDRRDLKNTMAETRL